MQPKSYRNNRIPSAHNQNNRFSFTVLTTVYLYHEFVARVIIFITALIGSIVYYQSSLPTLDLFWNIFNIVFIFLGCIIILLSLIWRNSTLFTQLAYGWSLISVTNSHSLSVFMLAYVFLVLLFYTYYVIDSNPKFQDFRFIDAIEFLERRIPKEDAQGVISLTLLSNFMTHLYNRTSNHAYKHKPTFIHNQYEQNKKT